MPTVRFLGRVVPSILKISLTSLPQIGWEESSAGLQMIFNIEVIESQIVARVDINKYAEEDFGHLYKRALDLTRACVDTVAFATGQALTVLLETFVEPDGVKRLIQPGNLALGRLCTFTKFPTTSLEDQKDFEKALMIVMSEYAVFMALNDLIQANTLPHHGATSCGRVVDSLRKLVAPNVDQKQGWRVLQSIVNADSNYIQWISKLSANPRHGDRSYIRAEDMTETLRRTWIVMNRFLEYRKSGNQSLPLDKFPLLTS